MLKKSNSRRSGAPEMRIFVEGLLIQASIGVHPHEYEATQPVVIDVDLGMGSMPAPTDDRLAETMDYALIADKAEEIALEAHVQLVETLADRIADWALGVDRRVMSARVRIRKPQALLKADAAGVEITKYRRKK